MKVLGTRQMCLASLKFYSKEQKKLKAIAWAEA
jgi:hypothetical protein